MLRKKNRICQDRKSLKTPDVFRELVKKIRQIRSPHLPEKYELNFDYCGFEGAGITIPRILRRITAHSLAME